MTSSERYGFTARERTELWERFLNGESYREIGHSLSKDHGSIRSVV